MTQNERDRLKIFQERFAKKHPEDNSFEMDGYKLLFLSVCWILGLYAGLAITAATGNFFVLPFTFVTTYLITQYKVVLLSINDPSMVKEIKTFSILFLIDIILLIIILI